MPVIQRTWEDHAYLTSPTPNDDDQKDQSNTTRSDSKTSKSGNTHKKQEPMNFDESDSIGLFRSVLVECDKAGMSKQVDRGAFICDPINGNILIEVMVKKIMASNARPYLIDCYTFDGAQKDEKVLSSKLLLKMGDDLRKDLGIMLMFKFMNSLWRQHHITYQGHPCETLVYRVVPMAKDFGAIEFVEGVRKIADIDELMKQNMENHSDRYNEIIDRLIATAAAS